MRKLHFLAKSKVKMMKVRIMCLSSKNFSIVFSRLFSNNIRKLIQNDYLDDYSTRFLTTNRLQFSRQKNDKSFQLFHGFQTQAWYASLQGCCLKVNCVKILSGSRLVKSFSSEVKLGHRFLPVCIPSVPTSPFCLNLREFLLWHIRLKSFSSL